MLARLRDALLALSRSVLPSNRGTGLNIQPRVNISLQQPQATEQGYTGLAKGYTSCVIFNNARRFGKGWNGKTKNAYALYHYGHVFVHFISV